MHAFYKVKASDEQIYRGIVFGSDESDMVMKLTAYEPFELTLQFGECYQDDLVEFPDIRDCSLFDFE